MGDLPPPSGMSFKGLQSYFKNINGYVERIKDPKTKAVGSQVEYLFVPISFFNTKTNQMLHAMTGSVIKDCMDAFDTLETAQQSINEIQAMY